MNDKNNYENIWSSVLDIVKGETTDITFKTWFLPLQIYKIDYDLNIIYISPKSNEKNTNLIIDSINNRWLDLLKDSFNDVLDSNFQVVVKENFEKISLDEKSPKAIKQTSLDLSVLNQENILNPKYTFENFVVGNSNSYAHAASLAVAESPGAAYNPLFIWGGSGLGKTHLIQAIGIYILSQNPNLNVLYTDSEMFTNEFIKATKENRMSDFRNKYRSVDVLIIDDIQFIEDKIATQEEFFHTFKNLSSRNKQIIISSDRAPNKLTSLDERLRSRFQSNLMANVLPADYETRVAILERKAENMNINIDEDLSEAIRFIAEKIKDNIRELEGAFNSTIFLATSVGDKPDKSMAKRVLKNILVNSGEVSITPEKIKKIVCKYYNLKVADLESSKKTNNLAYPRQIAMYLIRELTDSSLPQIGKYFGGKHHTTVKYGCEKIEGELKYDKQLEETIENLKAEIME